MCFCFPSLTEVKVLYCNWMHIQRQDTNPWSLLSRNSIHQLNTQIFTVYSNRISLSIQPTSLTVYGKPLPLSSLSLSLSLHFNARTDGLAFLQSSILISQHDKLTMQDQFCLNVPFSDWDSPVCQNQTQHSLWIRLSGWDVISIPGLSHRFWIRCSAVWHVFWHSWSRSESKRKNSKYTYLFKFSPIKTDFFGCIYNNVAFIIICCFC